MPKKSLYELVNDLKSDMQIMINIAKENNIDMSTKYEVEPVELIN